MTAVRLDICEDDDPLGTPLLQLDETDLQSLKLEISLGDLGKNEFKISRQKWGGSGLRASRTYYVRAYIPYIEATDPYWGFWLIGGQFVLVHPDEQGGEVATLGGPGPLWYLSRARLNKNEWTGHADVKVQDGEWYFIDKTYGGILNVLVNEDAASDYPALSAMGSPGWGGATDSDGVAWTEFGGIYRRRVGDDYLSIVRDLQRAGDFDVFMTPDLNLKPYVSMGEDRTGLAYGAGVVRFFGSKSPLDDPGINRNLVGTATRQREGAKQPTHVLVLGNDRRVAGSGGEVIEGSPRAVWAVDPNWVSGDAIVHGFMEFDSQNPVILERAGLHYINRSRNRGNFMVEAEVMPGHDESRGLYMPGRSTTDKGKYFIGDLTTWRTGQGGDLDLNNDDLRIAAIKLELGKAVKDDTDLHRQRNWKVKVTTGDDVEPSSTSTSSRNEGNSRGGCTCPLPAPPIPTQPEDTITDLARWSFDVDALSDGPGNQDSNVVRSDAANAMPGVTWSGAGFGVPSAGGGTSDNVAVTPGDTITVGGDFAWKWDPSVRDVMVRFYDSGDVLIQDNLWLDGSNYAVRTKYHVENNYVVPASAASIRFGWPGFPGMQLDDLFIALVTAGDEVEVPDGAVDYGDCEIHYPNLYTPIELFQCITDGLQEQINELEATVQDAPDSSSVKSDEFDGSSSVSWTTFGAPDSWSVNSVVKGRAYLRNPATTFRLCGATQTLPSFPFTVTTKLASHGGMRNFHRAGGLVFLTNQAPAIADDRVYFGFTNLAGASGLPSLIPNRILYSTDSAFGSETQGPNIGNPQVGYFRATLTSATNLTLEWSLDGENWMTLQSNYNPGFSVGAFGLGLAGAVTGAASEAIAATFEYFRVT